MTPKKKCSVQFNVPIHYFREVYIFSKLYHKEIVIINISNTGLNLIGFSSTSSKKFDIYPLNDESSQEVPAAEDLVERVKSPAGSSYEEPESMELPRAFSENDYMRFEVIFI